MVSLAGRSRLLIRRVVPILVILAATAARAFRLGFQELSGDEAFGYLWSQRSLGAIVGGTLELREPHPVASYFLQKAWMGLAGDSEFALRFSSLWFGVIAVALVFALARAQRLKPGTALLGAGLMAISPYAIWHSQNARMYSMSLALTLGAACGLVLALRGRPRAWLGYVLAGSLALQTHYYAGFVIAAINLPALVELLARQRRAALRRWAGANVAIAALTLPWLVVARETLGSYRGNGDSPTFPAMLWRSLSAFGAGESMPDALRVGVAVVAGALAVLGIAVLASRVGIGRRSAGFLTAYLAIPVLVTWVGAQARPIFDERYLVAAAPPFYLLAAAALGEAGKIVRVRQLTVRRAAVALWVVLLVATIASGIAHYVSPSYSKARGWRELAGTLERYAGGMDVSAVRLVENFPDPTLWYYYRGAYEHLVLPPAANNEARTFAEVGGLVEAGVRRVILPVQRVDWWDEHGLAEAALSRGYTKIAEEQVAGWPVQVYAGAPLRLPEIGVSFGGIITLVGGEAEPAKAVPPGGLVAVYLQWARAGGGPRGGEKVSVQLIGSDGRLIAQSDRELDEDLRGDARAVYGLPLPRDATPGAYSVMVIVYDPSTGGTRLQTEQGMDYVEVQAIEVGS